MSRYQLCARYHVNNVAKSFASVDSEELHVPVCREGRLVDDAGIFQLGKLLPPDNELQVAGCCILDANLECESIMVLLRFCEELYSE